MQKLILLACATFMIAGINTASFAAGKPSSPGASQSAPGQQVVPQTPGQQFRSGGAINDSPGASGYAPGQQFRSNGPSGIQPGASGFAPGSSNPRR